MKEKTENKLDGVRFYSRIRVRDQASGMVRYLIDQDQVHPDEAKANNVSYSSRTWAMIKGANGKQFSMSGRMNLVTDRKIALYLIAKEQSTFKAKDQILPYEKKPPLWFFERSDLVDSGFCTQAEADALVDHGVHPDESTGNIMPQRPMPDLNMQNSEQLDALASELGVMVDPLWSVEQKKEAIRRAAASRG